MLREFLNRKSEKWTPTLRVFFERHGITVEQIEDGAVLRYTEKSLTNAIKTTLVYSVIEALGYIAIGFMIGRALH